MKIKFLSNLTKKQKIFIVSILGFILVFIIFVLFSWQYIKSSDKDNLDASSNTNECNIEEIINSEKSIDEIDYISNDGQDSIKNEDTKEEESTNDENNEEASLSLPDAENAIKNNNNTNTENNKNETKSTNNNEVIQKDTENKISENDNNINNEIIVTIQNVNDVILSGKIVIKDNMTAFEALKVFADSKGIKVKYQGSGTLAYVTSIDGLKEKANGPSSGWMFKVDNVFPNVSAGSCKLKPGDNLIWIYSKDGGKDIGQR